MHVCFPLRLNANTANTHHQALGEYRAKGSGELKVEAKQQRCSSQGKKSLCPLSVLFNLFYINGASKHFQLAEDKQSRFCDVCCRSMSHSLQNHNSLS